MSLQVVGEETDARPDRAPSRQALLYYAL